MLPTPPPSPTLPSCAPEHRLGQILAGRLHLNSILGVGAYGVVYTARDVYTGRDYAVKALDKLGLDERQRRFQQREIQLHHEASHHPNVVSLIQIMEAEDTTYVVLEYCPEGDLFSSITERLFYAGNDDLVRDAFLQVLDAVSFCHSIGIYHRDLKPENILCTDGGHTLKLADFGLATRDERTSDYGCGSTFYMSSECQMASSSGQSSYASAPNDVWALGVILVNLACGRNPWKRASIEDPTFRAYLKDPQFLSSILPLSEELEVILRRIFDCNPNTRITLPELRKLVIRCPHFTAQPRRQVAPPTPPPMDFEPIPQSAPAKVVDSHPYAVMPPSPPLTPPAQAGFSPPPPTQVPSPAPAKANPACQTYLPLDNSSSPRGFSAGPAPAGPCSPLIGADLFNFIPSLGSWVRPVAFSSHAVSSLVST